MTTRPWIWTWTEVALEIETSGSAAHSTSFCLKESIWVYPHKLNTNFSIRTYTCLKACAHTVWKKSASFIYCCLCTAGLRRRGLCQKNTAGPIKRTWLISGTLLCSHTFLVDHSHCLVWGHFNSESEEPGVKPRTLGFVDDCLFLRKWIIIITIRSMVEELRSKESEAGTETGLLLSLLLDDHGARWLALLLLHKRALCPVLL